MQPTQFPSIYHPAYPNRSNLTMIHEIKTYMQDHPDISWQAMSTGHILLQFFPNALPSTIDAARELLND